MPDRPKDEEIEAMEEIIDRQLFRISEQYKAFFDETEMPTDMLIRANQRIRGGLVSALQVELQRKKSSQVQPTIAQPNALPPEFGVPQAQPPSGNIQLPPIPKRPEGSTFQPRTPTRITGPRGALPQPDQQENPLLA